MIDINKLRRILDNVSNVSIGVIGDFCIDAYWLLDETNIELSVETGKPTHAVVKQTYNLGAAGNLVNNLSALGINNIKSFGVIGNDLFGREMLKLMQKLNTDISGMIVQNENWDTSVYAKPYVDLDEQERIDFGRYNVISEKTADKLAEALSSAMSSLDGLIINQQLKQGIHSEYLIKRLQEIIDANPEKIILLDARDVSDRYTGVICKLNAIEAARVCKQKREINQAISVEEIIEYAKQIYTKNSRDIIITRSDRGIIAYDGTEIFSVPGILIVGQTDPVGAGDTTAATITSVLAAKASLGEAIEIGNYAAAVVVQKIRQTGTANPTEIIQLAQQCDYVYNPELAEDIRKAKYFEDTEIEIISPKIEPAKIKHIIFDNDGTISTLRQGWESIMEPVMIKAILGDKYHQASEELYQRIVKRVREYIEQSTGIETIVQMEALVEMVKQFGLVEKDEILDAMGYKNIYNQALMDMVEKRIDKLKRGELDKSDYLVKGADTFLKQLYEHGIKLYLASGTDNDDVIREAEILGYADYFEGRIYGWAGKGTGSAKKKVIEQILRENKLSGQELACIGDGPVELRLCKKVNGTAIGIASDEIRRYGLNSAKRTRLIKAGADIIVPDYSQREKLFNMLFDTLD